MALPGLLNLSLIEIFNQQAHLPGYNKILDLPGVAIVTSRSNHDVLVQPHYAFRLRCL